MRRALLTLGLFVTLLGIAIGTSPERASAAAGNVTFSQACDAGKANVTFNWNGTAADGQQIWIDLTLFDNGWQAGTFIGAGPIAGNATSYTWRGLNAGSAHFIRINQQLANGSWDPSATFRITTACGASAATNTPVAQVLGFTDKMPAANATDFVAPGGTLQVGSCTSPVYVVVRTNLPASRQMSHSWYLNGGFWPLNDQDLVTFPAGQFQRIFILPNDRQYNLNGSTVGFRLSAGDTIEAEGTVKTAC